MQLDAKLKLESAKICLRPLTAADAREEYCGWLNDPAVNQYLEVRFQKHDLPSLKEYIEKMNADPDSVNFAIVRKDTGKHIGNIKLGPINRHHLFGEIGLMIGDKSSWGQGIATEAIKLITEYGFKVLKLHKITAGVYAPNIGSVKAFLKAGFEQEGLFRGHYRSGDGYVDGIKLGKTND